MNESPRVSVIIPNYNHGRYLEKRIRTVLEQTFQDYQVIILDDASSDNSRDIINNFRPHAKVVKVVFNAANSGSTFRQWNSGIRLARGEYVWFAESDDYAAPSFLSVMVETLDHTSSVGLAYCDSRIVDSEGNLGGRASENPKCSTGLYKKDWDANIVLPGKEMIRRHLLRANTIFNASAVLFRKEAYIQAGYANEQLGLAGDWDMYGRILAQWDYAYVASCLNYQRGHGGSVRTRLAGTTREMREFCLVQHGLLHIVEAQGTEREAVAQGVLRKVEELGMPRGSRWSALWCLVQVGWMMAPHVEGYWRAVVVKLIRKLGRLFQSARGKG